MAFTTVNPTTGKVEATFDQHTPAEVEAKVEQAARAFDTYRRTTFAERAGWMRAAADLYDGEQPDIARLLTTEMGKTFAAAKGEVAKCALCMRWYADRAEGFLADEMVESAAGRSFIRYQPLGPVLAVMPWNFPLWQVVRFAAPALMAGNVGLLKHASNVPQSAILIEDLFRRAGFPQGVFSTLLVPAGEVAGLIADDRIVAVTLTGSEGAGRSVAQAAGQALKKCVLELGGSDPFLILSSADVEQAVKVAVTARVLNNGQSCIAAKRFVVVDAVADRFIPRFVDAMAALRVGDPFDPATDVGPLVSKAQRAEVASQVDDAQDKGAVVACGGDVVPGDGWFYQPTVLTGVTPKMRAYEEEVFGPVAIVEPVADLEEAIAAANRTTFGLGSSVWATDPEEQRRCIQEIEAGMVFVNSMVVSTPELPFGGIKRSGYGRELAHIGIREFCNAKAVWVA
ncbi:MAG TPA: NAD-dependent succinate-semialdehyde dehydrogenase [Acidimicrobiales bacterium]|nr:NAD-dependent succinate-semialdehyde dehydrogenase [Acidimicrobiales bacterium]